MKSSHWTLLAAGTLIIVGYLGTFSYGAPRPICPFPILTTFPALLLSSFMMSWIAALAPAAILLAWNPGLFRGQAAIPERSLLLLLVLTALSTLYFMAAWDDGVKFQGREYTYGICVLNVGWLLVLWVIFIQGSRHASFRRNLLAHWLLFAWLGWYAFPWLGELL